MRPPSLLRWGQDRRWLGIDLGAVEGLIVLEHVEDDVQEPAHGGDESLQFSFSTRLKPCLCRIEVVDDGRRTSNVLLSRDWLTRSMDSQVPWLYAVRVIVASTNRSRSLHSTLKGCP
jgi:hypothetical protein